MATSDRFNVLIVEPDSGTRAKLKHAVLALTTFHKLTTVSTIDEALSNAEHGFEKIDVVLLSRSFSIDQIIEFIQKSRATKRGCEWAYISICSAKKKDNEEVVDSFIEGVDGFLQEPYSADDLRQIAEIADRVRLMNEEKRKRAAMLEGLREMLEHIDAIATYSSCAQDTTTPWCKLIDAKDKIDKYRKQYFEIYISMLIEETAKATPSPVKIYSGPSQRIKQRIKEKTLTKLDSTYQGPSK